ncbi:hypothetical protein M409DRAFT_17088 [Zasmidium cellare ATCC 36951]|uniref:Secreted protein n=1 Tax=Zasmidium cellare ATCC 36951 TaxID=1080233 RepID=A0A6A6D4L5_ZASCE|nr:uncharacterized protein M409DRAFT_17088 [Zasmidium cellare ATCC 36951]KAF2173142.1 hypothetical protein M409DRAFT_17088 [Zasmidium cellare ATCC 36951]
MNGEQKIPPPPTEHPALPPRPQHVDPPPYNPQDYAGQPMGTQQFEPPADHVRLSLEQEDVSSPIHFTRDPKKLIGYLVPFPKPKLHNVPADQIPTRYLIYTPPPPPIRSDWKPKEGEKEGKIHKVQRKWEQELREAKTQNVKTMSWKGVKGKVTKGINWGMSQTKTSNLEFLNRIGGNQEDDAHADDGHHEGEQTNKTVKLEEMLLIYPASLPQNPDQIREEFVNTMLRSKSKAQRDSIIATGLLPVSFAIDVLATLIWPFGGLLEIDAVWLYSSIRGAKTSRSVTKRLSSTSDTNHDEDKLHLNFTPSSRLAVLEKYLATRCHEKDDKLFPSYVTAPSETEALEAIGWFPSSKGGAERNWEDEQWEITEVKDDLKSVMTKGAREWDKWCKAYEKQPEKALKK